jgi:hypothetical protein
MFFTSTLRNGDIEKASIKQGGMSNEQGVCSLAYHSWRHDFTHPRAERITGMSIDPQTLIIIMLIIFIIGLMIGISLGRPRYPRLPPY